MSIKENTKRFWQFLKEDTWQSWIVSIILIIILIKFIIFPALSIVTGTSLPLVVVESCSMYHETSFNSWWERNSNWYLPRNITKSDFESYWLRNGLNKGDIVFVTGYGSYDKGDIIIFNSETKYPIIHRIISLAPIQTKGDHNVDQIRNIETDISKDQIIGRAVARIPYLGWIKLIFFEPLKPKEQRGFCN